MMTKKNSNLNPKLETVFRRRVALTQWVTGQFAVPIIPVWQPRAVQFHPLESYGAGQIGPLHPFTIFPRSASPSV
jgi:hypothetical protein